MAMFLFLDFLKEPHLRWRLYLSYLFSGLAFLAKGPAAVPFFVPPLLIFWLISRDRNVLKGLLFPQGWSIFALVAFPWYLYCYLRLDRGHWDVFLRNDIMGKTYWPKGRDPLWGFVLDFIANFSPWILLILYKTKDRWKELFASSEATFWSCWSLVPLLIVATCATKHGKYTLPLFPAVASLLGIWIASAYSDLKGRIGPRAKQITLLVVGTLLLAWIAYYSLAEPFLLNYRYRTLSPMVQKIQQIQGNAPLFSYERRYESLIYYYQSAIPVMNESELKKMLKEHRSFLLVAEDKDWESLEDEDLCLLAEYRPFLRRDKAARLLGSPDFCKQTGLSPAGNIARRPGIR
jgi:4-amino-4-deoxy-L-arabinose transferase-like glycosyltransferase